MTPLDTQEKARRKVATENGIKLWENSKYS
jgi:hypothetical protein